MARQHNLLSARAVETLKKPGMHRDGWGLYLYISPGGSKSWIWRHTGLDGKRHDYGLGSTHAVSLKDARVRASKLAGDLTQGIDPLSVKRAEKAERRVAEVRNITFGQCAAQYIEAQSPRWKSDKEAADWNARLRDYVYPVIGSLPVGMVDLALILKVLKPHWETMASMKKVRGYIEAILDYATVHGYRSGDNPARWSGNLAVVLPIPSKTTAVEHFEALPYREIGDFMVKLREVDKLGARALEFAILTAARRGEVMGAKWSDIYLQDRLWVVPAAKMKMGKEHKVALSDAAMALLGALPHQGDLVFSGLSTNTIHTVCTKLRSGITVHGFRSAFRDWAYESTGFAREHVEHCLAHIERSTSELAYKRGDALEKRRKIMDSWARFCDTISPQASDNVRRLRSASR